MARRRGRKAHKVRVDVRRRMVDRRLVRSFVRTFQRIETAELTRNA